MISITGVTTPCTAIPPNGAVDITVTPPDNYTYVWSTGAITEDIIDLPGGIYTVTVTLAGSSTATAEFIVIAFTPGPLSVSGVVNPDTCGQGIGGINLSVFVGYPPFNFNWSNGAQTEDLIGLPGGSTYFVTVTDDIGGVQVLDFFVPNYTGFFNNNISNYYSLHYSDNTTCNSPPNGVIDYTPLTSIPFNWIWNNGVTTPDNLNLPAGVYVATVTMGNCTQSWNPSVAIFDSPDNPVLAVAPVNPICGQANGSISMTVTAGAAPYTYAWSNGASTEDLSNIVAGDYSVTVNGANGCIANSSTNLDDININFSISGTVVANTSCTVANGSIATSVSPSQAPPGLSYTYDWSNGAHTPNIAGLQSGNYTVTVTLGISCSANSTFFVGNGSQVPTLSFAITAESCQGPGSVNLSVAGGTGPFGYLWSNSATTEDLPSVPAGNYGVTVTAADGCTAVGMANVLDNNTGADTTYVAGITCDTSAAGIFVLTLTGQDGCDSLIITTVTYSAADTTVIFGISCEINDAGVFEQSLMNQYGCDSTVITTIIYTGSDTTSILGISCDINEAGVFEQSLTNQYGCDSIVITTITYAAPDTTALFETTCDINEAGVFEQTLTNSNGCDSLIITTIIYAAADSTALYDTSCDLSAVGIFEQTLINSNGCDSIIITTISFAAGDTTALFDTSCDVSDVGVFEQTLTNADGCDSVVITTITYAAADTTAFFGTTCDSNVAGVFEQTLTNANGCDSVAITTITLVAADTTELFGTSCNPASVGVFVQSLVNQGGCDSIVVMTVTYSLSDTTLLHATTCDPAQAGSFVQDLTTTEGCDSVVITTVVLAPPSSTALTATTCDPLQAGTFTQTLTNWQGCDSVVTTTVMLLPSSSSNVTTTTCEPSQAGTFTQTMTNWQGCDSVVTVTVSLLPNSTSALQGHFCEGGSYIFNGMVLDAPGIYTTNYPASNGCDSIVTLTLSALPTSPITNIALEVLQGYVHNGNVIVADTVLEEHFINIYGCDSTVVTKFTILPNATYSLVEQWQLEVVPNPTDGILRVQFHLPQPGTLSLRIWDMMGREMAQDFGREMLYGTGDHNLMLDATDWPSGLYLVQFKSANGTAALKLVVE